MLSIESIRLVQDYSCEENFSFMQLVVHILCTITSYLFLPHICERVYVLYFVLYYDKPQSG